MQNEKEVAREQLEKTAGSVEVCHGGSAGSPAVL